MKSNPAFLHLRQRQTTPSSDRSLTYRSTASRYDCLSFLMYSEVAAMGFGYFPGWNEISDGPTTARPHQLIPQSQQSPRM
jgi:hypothetical protein